MEIKKIKTRITSEEKEVHLLYDYVDKTWIMDTMIMKYYNKAKRQGWKQTAEYVYDDGTVCGGAFEAPDHAVTIRSAEKKKLSEKQLDNLFGTDDE